MKAEGEFGGLSAEKPRHLKQVSRIKHLILSRYLPSWEIILGSRHTTLNYVDCFAGPGKYELNHAVVDGSPIIAAKAAVEYSKAHITKEMNLVFVEEDETQEADLRRCLADLGKVPRNVTINVKRENSHTYIPELLETRMSQCGTPSFFLVDPYGHPLSVPIINKILDRPRTEVLINLMWYRINMDMGNPMVQQNVSNMLGGDDWRSKPFVQHSGFDREREFVEYFCSQLNARYVFPFRIQFDIEDRVHGGRTKYYLLHASNHPKAVLLMKEVMWPLGDEEGTFDYSGSAQEILISRSPHDDELADILRCQFRGKTMTFEGIRADTWKLPFVEKHYRSVLLRLAESGDVSIRRISSRRSGLKGSDQITFIKMD